jgi:hypothetical protein
MRWEGMNAGQAIDKLSGLVGRPIDVRWSVLSPDDELSATAPVRLTLRSTLPLRSVAGAILQAAARIPLSVEVAVIDGRVVVSSQNDDTLASLRCYDISDVAAISRESAAGVPAWLAQFGGDALPITRYSNIRYSPRAGVVFGGQGFDATLGQIDMLAFGRFAEPGYWGGRRLARQLPSRHRAFERLLRLLRSRLPESPDMRDEAENLMERRIPTLRFEHVLLRQAVETVAELSGCNVVVQWNNDAISWRMDNRDARVSLSLHDVTADEALDQICAAAGGSVTGAAYSPDEGILLVSDRPGPAEPDVIRVYDVRDLIWAGIAGERRLYEASGLLGLTYELDWRTDVARQERAIGQIMAMSRWPVAPAFTVALYGGRLVVSGAPAAQRWVADVLGQLRAAPCCPAPRGWELLARGPGGR